METVNGFSTLHQAIKSAGNEGGKKSSNQGSYKRKRDGSTMHRKSSNKMLPPMLPLPPLPDAPLPPLEKAESASTMPVNNSNSTDASNTSRSSTESSKTSPAGAEKQGYTASIVDGKRMLRCNDCQYECRFPSKMERHRINKHTTLVWYKCGLCDMKFKQMSTLARHFETVVHSEEQLKRAGQPL